MRVLIVGASGMVGLGVLRACLLATDVEQVTVIGRDAIASAPPKLQQIVCANLFDLALKPQQLQRIDACFFCLGVSSSGMKEAAYRRLTYDLTLAIAGQLVSINPAMRLVYVSGAGTDSSERGRSMWARIKGQTENALLALPFAGVYLFRPAIIQPLHGIQSKTASYRYFYRLTKPLLPLMSRLCPGLVVTSDELAHAMLKVARQRPCRRVLESGEIAQLARGEPAA